MKIVEAWAVLGSNGNIIQWGRYNHLCLKSDKLDIANVTRKSAVPVHIIIGQKDIDELNQALAYWEKRNVKGSKERL